MPDQMMLQIHESIGHPLELDRILGDERNFAGTSFVTLDMFGSYRYGSELLNVTFDPTRPEEFATYGWDDDGLAAERQYLIRKGILERPLGGAVSQARAGIAGRGQHARLRVEPPAHRPHGEPQHRAGRFHARRADRRHRARRDDAHQRLLVHRRLAQQVPVRLRVGPHDPRAASWPRW